MTPYYADESVTLYHGDAREVLPLIRADADCIVTDPPYGETSLEWDRWPTGWPSWLTGYASSMWCFGSMRMFLDHRDEFADWKLSQDVVWEKHTGSGPGLTDRFYRVHEVVTHWYRGQWSEIYHSAPRTLYNGPRKAWTPSGRPQTARTAHRGAIGERAGYQDDGTRLMRSVVRAQSMHGNAINETEKPVGILEPLIAYACPPGGMVLDPFAGSCSTAVAARAIGRRAVCIEAREQQCEAAAKRLAQQPLDFGEVSA